MLKEPVPRPRPVLRLNLETVIRVFFTKTKFDGTRDKCQTLKSVPKHLRMNELTFSINQTQPIAPGKF